MSELIQKNDNRATIRRKLLTGASALALTAYVTSAGIANADDTDRPTIWIEMGGQMEIMQNLSEPFTAPFMSLTPAPDVYNGLSFTGIQRSPRFAFGEEAKISFQPEDSNWIFSAGIRYGRSHAHRHRHNQRAAPGIPFHSSFDFYFYGYHIQRSYTGTKTFPTSALADAQTQFSEQHTVLDFQAGKDVGLGLFGRHVTSTLSGGVRFASFVANSSTYDTARPSIMPDYVSYCVLYCLAKRHAIVPEFHQYTMFGNAQRSFKGIGPSLSWSASADIAGNPQDGELTLDWGINGSVLFGRQKAKTSHTSRAYHQFATSTPYYFHKFYTLSKPAHGNHSTRSRRVTVPNIGGYAGLSVKYTDVKVSIGYRYDTFLNAMDIGIDAAKKSNITFQGPYASISIGLGD